MRFIYISMHYMDDRWYQRNNNLHAGAVSLAVALLWISSANSAQLSRLAYLYSYTAS